MIRLYDCDKCKRIITKPNGDRYCAPTVDGKETIVTTGESAKDYAQSCKCYTEVEPVEQLSFMHNGNIAPCPYRRECNTYAVGCKGQSWWCGQKGMK